MKSEINNLMELLVDYIIKQVQNNSFESGIQLIVSYENIEKAFNIRLDKVLKKDIINELMTRHEVMSVEEDGDFGLDIVISIMYAPNYVIEDLLNVS
jgi:hypothetical protein